MLKKTDYVEQPGTIKIQFKRGVRINEKATNLTAELSFNHLKGLFTITAKWDNDQIMNSDDDQATLKALTDLMLVARDKGIQMRMEWEELQPARDPEQMNMGFPDQDEEKDKLPFEEDEPKEVKKGRRAKTS